MRLCFKIASVLLAAALVLPTSFPAAAAVTAAQVTDRETLEAFVLGVHEEIKAFTAADNAAALWTRFKTEGDWKSGSMFLILFLPSGEALAHGADRTAEAKNLFEVEDDHGTKVVQKLLQAAASGGGFVDYHDGAPKTAYAIDYISRITAKRLVLVGGYSQDVSHVPVHVAELRTPAITASEVIDRDTLVQFVEEAADAYHEAVMSEGFSDLVGVRNAFRVEDGDWKSGSVYLFIVSSGGITIFHGSEPEREGRPTDMMRTDSKGVQIAQELLGGALREGRKFLRYHYDNPAIDGDEETGSPKLGYAVSFPISPPNSPNPEMIIVGSGIYPDSE